MDNEAERQKYELQAERIRQEMNERLGTPSEGLELRNERLNALQLVEAQINETSQHIHATSQHNYETSHHQRHQRMMAAASENNQGFSGTSGGGRPQHPRSANLEQLYHEAIPMDKALSHSGPSAFGNGLLQHQHPVSQFICEPALPIRPTRRFGMGKKAEHFFV